MFDFFHILQVLVITIVLMAVVFLAFYFGAIEYYAGRKKPQNLVLKLSPILEAKNIQNGARVTAIFYNGHNAKDVENFINSTDYNKPDFYLNSILLEEPVVRVNQYSIRFPDGSFVTMNEREFDEEFELLNWRTGARKDALNYPTKNVIIQKGI